MISAAIERYCNYQERCHQEVRRKLAELGCYYEDQDPYIAELIEKGLLNEERFARAFARGRFRIRHWGVNKIRYELKQRKVSDYCIRKGLEEIDADEYESVMRQLIERKLYENAVKKSPEPVRRQKVVRFMAQKGFETDRVIDIINDFQKS